jgi:hypothetical protein
MPASRGKFDGGSVPVFPFESKMHKILVPSLVTGSKQNSGPARRCSSEAFWPESSDADYLEGRLSEAVPPNARNGMLRLAARHAREAASHVL